jgi:hypothetical protein
MVMLTAVQTTASSVEEEDDSLDFTGMASAAAPCGRFAHVPRATPHLPESFENFNARDFIEEAYGLATQI